MWKKKGEKELKTKMKEKVDDYDIHGCDDTQPDVHIFLAAPHVIVATFSSFLLFSSLPFFSVSLASPLFSSPFGSMRFLAENTHLSCSHQLTSFFNSVFILLHAFCPLKVFRTLVLRPFLRAHHVESLL